MRFLLEEVKESFHMQVGLMEARHVLEGSTNEPEFRRLIKLRVAPVRDRRRVLCEGLLKGVLELRYSSHGFI